MPEGTAEQPKKEYTPFDPSAIEVSTSSSFDDYVKLPAEEALKAHIVELKMGKKFNKNAGEDRPRLYIYFEVDEGEGQGQQYRWDCNPKIVNSGKRTELSLFLEKVYGEVQDGVDYADILGRPVRIELSEPWGDKLLQFVNGVKKPLPSQARVVVGQEVEVLPEETLTPEQFDQMFDAQTEPTE